MLYLHTCVDVAMAGRGGAVPPSRGEGLYAPSQQQPFPREIQTVPFKCNRDVVITSPQSVGCGHCAQVWSPPLPSLLLFSPPSSPPSCPLHRHAATAGYPAATTVLPAATSGCLALSFRDLKMWCPVPLQHLAVIPPPRRPLPQCHAWPPPSLPLFPPPCVLPLAPPSAPRHLSSAQRGLELCRSLS